MVSNSGMTTNDALLFHEKCGTLIKLSNNNKTAERRRPLDEFNNGVVMTNRPLRHNEMFEVCVCMCDDIVEQLKCIIKGQLFSTRHFIKKYMQ